LHIRPDRCVEDPVGVPTVWPPADRGWAGDGPADGGPLLLGVMISLVSSSPSWALLELAILFWLLFMSCRRVLDDGLNPLAYICVGGLEVEESRVLERLPLMAGRDIVAKAL
jgi:hypothetical protein